MNIFISEADRQSARRIAIKNIARFYNLSDWEVKPNDELLDEIYGLEENSAVVISELLKNYFSAYDEWFDFYQQRKKIETENGTEYIINSNEKKELGELINNRQNALDALQKKFDELQLSKFNSQTFGTDISGIIYNQEP
jgi:hypothetical protein